MKTTKRMLKILLLISTVFLTSNQMIAQTDTSITQTVCAGSANEPYLINPPTAGSTYQWTLDNGTTFGTITSGQGTSSISINWGLTAGVETLRMLETNNGCNATEVILLVTIVEAPTADAGLAANVCVGEAYALSGTATNSTGVSWAHNGAGTITGANTTTPIYTPAVLDVTVTLTMTVTGSSTCADATDAVVLTVNQAPTADAGGDTTLCEGESYIFVGTSVGNQTMISWNNNGGDGSFTNGTTSTPTYTPGTTDIANGMVTLTMTVTGSSPCTDAISSMIITINQTPTPGPIWHN